MKKGIVPIDKPTSLFLYLRHCKKYGTKIPLIETGNLLIFIDEEG
jgi:hypothetical protein